MNAAHESTVRTALILDDDAVSRTVIGKILENFGVERVEAIRGAEASKVLDDFIPDLVVVDGLLPDTDGLRWIQKERARLPRHVVFASAFWKDLRSHSQLGSLGVAAVVHKPFTVTELSRVFSDMLKHMPLGATMEPA